MSLGLTATDSRATATDDIQWLVWGLRSKETEERQVAAAEIRVMTRTDDGLRQRLAEAQPSVLPPLLAMLNESDADSVESALYALLNLSVQEKIKLELVKLGAVQAVMALVPGAVPSIHEGITGVLFSLSLDDEAKHQAGQSSAIPFLIQMLVSGMDRAKQDALLGLYNLSLLSTNKAALLQARVVHPSCASSISRAAHKFSDTAISLLRNLVTREEGREAVVLDAGVPALARRDEWGSSRGKEESAAVLLVLCQRSQAHRRPVLETNIVEPVRTLARTGTERGEAKGGTFWPVRLIYHLPLLSGQQCLAFSRGRW